MLGGQLVFGARLVLEGIGWVVEDGKGSLVGEMMGREGWVSGAGVGDVG